MSDGEAGTYAEGLRISLEAFGPGLLAVIAVSAVLAWWAYRKEREQRGRRAGWLAMLVFALGVPGLLVYLVERRRAPMGRCAACGANVPQNRTLCAACGAERARPRMTGVEVFA